VASVVIGVGVAGCGGQSPTTNRTSALGTGELAYVATIANSGTGASGLIFSATQALRAQCMAQKGFHYVREPDGGAGTPAPPSTFQLQPSGAAPSVGWLTAYRAKWGFGFDPAGQPTRDPEDAYLKSLPSATQKRWLAAWFHTGKGGGCYNEANIELYGSKKAWERASGSDAAAVNGYLTRSAEERPAAVASVHRWSACMNRVTGRSFASEPALVDWVASAYQKTAFSKEIHFAVADTRCAYSTGQASAYEQAFRWVAAHIPNPLYGTLVASYRLQQKAAQRANKALTGGLS